MNGWVMNIHIAVQPKSKAAIASKTIKTRQNRGWSRLMAQCSIKVLEHSRAIKNLGSNRPTPQRTARQTEALWAKSCVILMGYDRWSSN